ncbi:transcriptional regulator [Ochrobactrum sp. CM-21-5]|nr:transcriptional regulator [Ochrobactrum sp. CM-21-5]MBC2887117.1 transcriptional regulator [Ochrobactrum sp. CM-21-5]
MRLFSGKRILVLEDSFLLSEEAETRLTNAGAIVLGPVSTASQALDYLESETVDAVVMDVALEPEAVLPLIAELEHGAIPFIFALSDNPRLDSQRFAGFVLSARNKDLSTIAEALFLRRNVEQ